MPSNKSVRCAILGLFICLLGCKKWIEVPAPLNSIASNNVYSSDATSIAILNGIYASLSQQDQGQGNSSIMNISLCAGLSADELAVFQPSNVTSGVDYFYQNNLGSNTQGGGIWTNIYPLIYIANDAIDGLNASASLTPEIKQQLLGESYFLRAFFYFYLTELYGDVPMVTTTDYSVNKGLPRSSQNAVFNQMIADLRLAQSFLSSEYLDATLLNSTPTNRVRPSKWAAEALLARIYLYSGDYADAENEADSVIANNSLFALDSLNYVFLPTSLEAIWQIQPVGTNYFANTGEGSLFVLPFTGPTTNYYNVYLSNYVVSAFEPGDARKLNWVDSVIVPPTTYYFPYKYKIGQVDTTTDEYIMMLRLAEVYLVRAEARVQQGNIVGARADLYSVRKRAWLGPPVAGDKISLLAAILHERQVELFTEWGNRWFDLRRSGIVGSIMDTVTTLKGGKWMGTDTLYPIQRSELAADPNLVQNPGYTN